MLCALVVAAAFGAPPIWVTDPSVSYPPDKYVTGVGVAEDRASAEARARAAIAAVFETTVASVTRLKEEELRAGKAGRETVTSKVAASQEVVAVTAAVLEGANIAAAWTDDTGQVHALAVLDRVAAADVMRRRLAEGDAAVVEALTRLGKEQDRAAGARIGWRVAAVLALREGLSIRLRALDPKADTAPPAAMAGAGELARRALAAPTVRVDATGPGAEGVGAALARALLAVGLGAVGSEPKPDLVASVEVEAAPAVTSGAWTIVRLAARVRFVREGSAEAWAEVAESAKGTATSPGEATRRASTALAKQVEERLAEALRRQLERP